MSSWSDGNYLNIMWSLHTKYNSPQPARLKNFHFVGEKPEEDLPGSKTELAVVIPLANSFLMSISLTASINHDKLGWAPERSGSVSSLLGFKLPLPMLTSHLGKHSAQHRNKRDSDTVCKESWEHLNQTGRLQWKKKFRTSMMKLHYIHLINKYSLSTFSLKNTFIENGTSTA